MNKHLMLSLLFGVASITVSLITMVTENAGLYCITIILALYSLMFMFRFMIERKSEAGVYDNTMFKSQVIKPTAIKCVADKRDGKMHCAFTYEVVKERKKYWRNK